MQAANKEPSSLPVLGSQPQPQDTTSRQQQQEETPNTRRDLFIRPAQMSLFARVSCYPPLGQVSCPQRIQKTLELERDDMLRFTVVIELSTAFLDQPWEVHIWHNIPSPAGPAGPAGTAPEWTALPLQRVPATRAPLLLNGTRSEDHDHRCVFSGEIALPTQGGYAQFTVRYRTGPNVQWQWVNDRQRGMKDGELVFASRGATFAPPVNANANANAMANANTAPSAPPARQTPGYGRTAWSSSQPSAKDQLGPF